MGWRIYLSGECPVSLESYKRGYVAAGISDKMRTYGVMFVLDTTCMFN